MSEDRSGEGRRIRPLKKKEVDLFASSTLLRTCKTPVTIGYFPDAVQAEYVAQFKTFAVDDEAEAFEWFENPKVSACENRFNDNLKLRVHQYICFPVWHYNNRDVNRNI